MKHYSAQQIKGAVSYADLLEPIAQSLVQHSQGKAVGSIAHLEWGDNEIHIKNGYVLGEGIFVVKVATSFPQHAAMPLNGLQMAFDAQSGQPLALLQDEGYLTDARTAVAGAVAARALAPQQIRTVGILGTGMQGYMQPLALRLVRSYERLLIWGRSVEKARALAEKLRGELEGIQVEVYSSVQAVVEQSDLLITATGSREPLVKADWLRPGMHITALGGDGLGKVELEPKILTDSRLFVDSIEANLGRGDVEYALREGAIQADGLIELGQVIAGQTRGRLSDFDVTVAKLVGLGVQDLAAVQVALSKLHTH